MHPIPMQPPSYSCTRRRYRSLMAGLTLTVSAFVGMVLIAAAFTYGTLAREAIVKQIQAHRAAHDVGTAALEQTEKTPSQPEPEAVSAG